ncbi:hypothetical protein [Lentibacter sp. XHP0401]|uniref:hypothetical protein n=1 Tax=Lentibacter sp. XHP0401 TaxID=2984334 RepID=UPI0021E7F47C|nr:hypothetical protein [Lentibacter sp. XHP0401]MCV2894569.1 hypothetical protein [Lentibacter sp. XHP0401]
MASPSNKRVKILLEKDCEFQIGIRKGRVLELRPEGYFVFWEEWADPDTGECHESEAGVISYEAIVTENNMGKLKLLKRPLAKPVDPNGVRLGKRSSAEVARQRFRKQYALAIQEMLENGELKPTRDDFQAKLPKIVKNGKSRYENYLAEQSIKGTRRGGAKVKLSRAERERLVEFHHGFKCGQALWGRHRRWREVGTKALYDKYGNCGKSPYYDSEVKTFVSEALGKVFDQERVTIKSCVESVQALIDAENDRRERLPVPKPKLKRPGYDYIRDLIKESAPLDHAIRKHGWDKAYKDMHALGLGIETHRALERVEIDEYTVDLFVLMERTGLFDHLPESLKLLIGLDGSAHRVTLSAAIDVHTRCFLALQIVPQAVESPLAQTLEMIYMDKSPIADAAGAKFGWPMAGAPEAIVFDRGPAYITDDAYDILASLGITNLGAPAGKPWLKPFIERVFRTVHEDLLLRFSGRAFSNVVERGENDAAKRATLTLEAFLGWLVRWTVDAYHTRTHAALRMSPAQAWAKATKVSEPRSLSSDEMRSAFGVHKRRKLGPKGLLVDHIYYQTDEVIKKRYKTNTKHVEVLRWDGDIGAISIMTEDGSWTTATAADPRWIGKTDTDLRVWLSERPDEDEEEGRARRNFIIDINDESYRLKRLAGLITLPRTPDELDNECVKFSRFVDTAERRHAAGEYRELLEGEPEPEVSRASLDPETITSSDGYVIGVEISDEDSME